MLFLGMAALEWPLPLVVGALVHRSLAARLIILPIPSLLAVLIY
jgi:hypothetical protein